MSLCFSLLMSSSYHIHTVCCFGCSTDKCLLSWPAFKSDCCVFLSCLAMLFTTLMSDTFFWVNTLNFTCRTVQMACMPSAHYLPITYTHTLSGVERDTENTTHVHTYVWLFTIKPTCVYVCVCVCVISTSQPCRCTYIRTRLVETYNCNVLKTCQFTPMLSLKTRCTFLVTVRLFVAGSVLNVSHCVSLSFTIFVCLLRFMYCEALCDFYLWKVLYK